MLLKVMDRLVVLSLLPKEADFGALRIAHELRMNLSFSEEERQSLAMHEQGDQLLWSNEADLGKEVAIGPGAAGMIVDALRKLDKEKKLTEDHLGIYERFIGAGDAA